MAVDDENKGSTEETPESTRPALPGSAATNMLGAGDVSATAEKPPRSKRKSRARPRKSMDDKGTKRPWTAEEDAEVVRLVAKHGPKGWSTIAAHIPHRVGKQCRERWQNHLDPSVSKAPWSAEEEAELLRLHKEIGNKWVEIANRMPGRTDSSVKNQFHKLTYHRPELAGLPKDTISPAEQLGRKRAQAKAEARAKAEQQAAEAQQAPVSAGKRRKTMVGVAGGGAADGSAVKMAASAHDSPTASSLSALDTLLMFAASD